MNERKELLKGIVLEIILGREQVQSNPTQFGHLISGVLEVMIRRKIDAGNGKLPLEAYPDMPIEDSNIIREIFWDLVVDKVITIGLNPDNPNFPHFKLHS
jgi:hypothetical protein